MVSVVQLPQGAHIAGFLFHHANLPEFALTLFPPWNNLPHHSQAFSMGLSVTQKQAGRPLSTQWILLRKQYRNAGLVIQWWISWHNYVILCPLHTVCTCARSFKCTFSIAYIIFLSAQREFSSTREHLHQVWSVIQTEIRPDNGQICGPDRFSDARWQSGQNSNPSEQRALFSDQEFLNIDQGSTETRV